MTNWKSFVPALIPLIAYGIKFAGFWPEAIPLPPFDQVWPPVIAILGVGFWSKDKDVTGGTRDQ